MAKTVGVDKSSIKDACRVVVANLEFCLSSTGYDPDSCKPEVASVERCCRRFWVCGLAAKRARRGSVRCFSALVERARVCSLAQQVTAGWGSGALHLVVCQPTTGSSFCTAAIEHSAALRHRRSFAESEPWCLQRTSVHCARLDPLKVEGWAAAHAAGGKAADGAAHKPRPAKKAGVVDPPRPASVHGTFPKYP